MFLFQKKIIKVDDLCERFDEKCSRRAVLNDLAKKSKKTTGWIYKYIYNIEIISIAVISIILFILLSCFNDSGLDVGKILNRLCFAEKNVYIFLFFIIFNIHFFELSLKFYQIYINIEIFFIISN